MQNNVRADLKNRITAEGRMTILLLLLLVITKTAAVDKRFMRWQRHRIYIV